MLNWDLENEIKLQGYNVICGCDEAGRGPLAGEVAAAACILPQGIEIKGLNDSKKLSEKKREELFKVIQEASISCAVATCSVQEIEEYNILECALLAMRRAVEMLDVKPEFILVDGNINRGFSLPSKAVIGGKIAQYCRRIHTRKGYEGQTVLSARRKIPHVRICKTQGLRDQRAQRGNFEIRPLPRTQKSFLAQDFKQR